MVTLPVLPPVKVIF